MKIIKGHFWLVWLVLFMSSCSKEELLPDKNRGELVEFSEGGSLSKNQIIDYVTEFSIQDIAAYDVSYYYLTYRTEYEGKPINARGLLLLPNGVDSIHLIAYFHGTYVPLKIAGIDQQIPSLYKGQKNNFLEVRTMGLSWASAGYTVFLPDYIGYGITEEKEHPYVYYPELFKANIDGLLATKQWLASKSYPEDNRLFITGWSQGGGACLSAHKYIEEQYADAFTVVASSGLAGPYNFAGFLEDLFNRKDEAVNIISIYSWGVYVINKFSPIKRPTDQLWSYPVYDQVSSLITPSNIPDEVFNNFFISKIIDGSDTAMIKVIENNSYHKNWKPVGKVFLHHGDADAVVPYFNSVDAYNGLTAQGGDITLYTYSGGDHDTDLKNYVFTTLNDFNALK